MAEDALRIFLMRVSENAFQFQPEGGWPLQETSGADASARSIRS